MSSETTLSLETLEDNLDAVRKDVKTDSYPMSIGELVSMYQDDELVLHPEYQRYFRWTLEQKSKLIESILIGLPLPSFFVAQDDKGKWEIVDGMQRLSTIFDFMGLLKEDNKKQDNYKRFNKLTNDGLFYLKSFGNKGWDDFSVRIQRDFKRTRMQLTILLRETNSDAKFELFQRLNSGGTAISGQELRNAILAGENQRMLHWFEKLAKNESFVSVTSLSKKTLETRYDMELVLRFIVFLSVHQKELKQYNSLDVFLTHVLREFIKDESFDYDQQEKVFCDTFEKIHAVGGKGALRYKNEPGKGKFSIAFFEAVALGIAQNIDNLPADSILREKIDSIGKQGDYVKASKAGTSTVFRISTLLDLGKNYLKK